MYFTKFFIPTLREAPSDADIVSAKLMLRAGMIRKLASGLYEWLPLGLRVLRNVENIIRTEMNRIDGQEVWLPIMQPKELWEETGRWVVYGKELFRIKDRKESDFCLGPTAEEVITDIVRREVRSYRQLPVMLYQFGVKFRDEIRPRFGIMRAREFLMKDAYSFHADEQDAGNYYQKAFEAYKNICGNCGLNFRPVEATTGNIGGSFSHEFMVLADTGEEEIVWCGCGYGSNIEKAECPRADTERNGEELAVSEVHTPGLKSVDEVSAFLKEKSDKFIKTLVYMADGAPLVALVRGDYEINEAKLQQALGAQTVFLADAQSVKHITGADTGFAGPLGLKKEIRIIADFSVECIINAVTGANKNDYHLVNVNIERDFKPSLVADIRKVTVNDLCPRCGGKLEFCRGIEIGHTFKLGLKYSKAMKAQYLDAQGKENLMVMGCYGIGVSRIVAAAIEQSHDENGIIWPVQIAPFKVYIVAVNWDDENIRKTAVDIHDKLTALGIETLLDDRPERAGIKFKDADLTGIPVRITIGDRNLKDGKVEFKLRKDKNTEASLVPFDKIINEVQSVLANSR